jgi:RHS repeat-associated protein
MKSYNYIVKNENEPAFYYHSDHLGSASYVTNGDGKVTQTLNYLPYGEDWVDLQYFDLMPAENNLGVYKFNGKEKDAESGYNYYGARYYDSEKISWISVDPMSDKYPNLSPYVYCANNPVKLIDPNGEDIVIKGNDGQTYNYGKDLKYGGEDKFIKSTIETLNIMNSIKEGETVISELVGSTNIYNITNKNSEKGTAGFVEGKDGGKINMNNELSLLTISHELFHAYQYENGQCGPNVNNEVEAYLYSSVINSLYNNSGGPSDITGVDNEFGRIHEKAMNDLLFNGYSQGNYEKAINTFLLGNTKGELYREHNYEIKEISYNPLIKNFVGFLNKLTK